MHLKYESQLREPLVYGDKTYHQVTEDIVKPIESVSYLNIFITKFLYIFLFICITSLNSACNKKDIEVVNESSQNNEFFKRNDSYKNTFNEINLGYADEKILNEIITKYGEIDKKTLLSKKVKNFIGQPLWDISYALKNEDGKVVLVTPFEKDYKNKSFFLISYLRKNGEINYKLIDDNNKQNKLKATTKNSSLSRSAFSSLIKFCKSLRDKYFSNSTVIRVGSDQLNTNNTTYFTFHCWYEYSSDANGYTTTNTHCRYKIIFSGSNVNELEPTSEIEGYGNSGGGGGGGGWISTTTSPNHSIIDSLAGFPCAQAILLSAFTNSVCSEVASLINQTFSVDSTYNLTYSVDHSLSLSNLINGYTNPPIGGSSWYEQKVFLNPGVLTYSTKEFTLSTLIHEGVHAVIDFWRDRYIRGMIDSTQFKNMFPIFWNTHNPPQYDVERAQHEAMAASYVSQMVRLIMNYNPSINPTMANALAWKGLHGTTAWKMKSDTAQILNLIHIARRDNADSTFTSLYNLSKCQ